MTGGEKLNVVLFNRILPCGSSTGSSSVSIDYKKDREISTGTKLETRSYLEVGEQVGRMLDQCDSGGLSRCCETDQ
jgi:hypothetical protein